MNRKTIFAAALFGLTIFAAQPAFAQESHEVRYADLDLTNARDQGRLDMRLRNAARAVCHIGNDYVPLEERRARAECYQTALGKARTQMAQLQQRGPAHSR